MRISRGALVFVTITLTACGGGHASSGSPAQHYTPHSTLMSSNKSIGSATPAPLGAPQQPPREATPLYPANAGITKTFINPMKIGSIIGLSTLRQDALKIDSITLHRWANTVTARTGFKDYLIDPNREVYEVTTSFDSPYWIRDNEWSSGFRAYIIDAVTGHVYVSRTWGAMTQNDGQVRARLMQTNRKAIHVVTRLPKT